MLSIQKVSFGYNPENEVLSNISFQVKKGEYVALLGESGCGKSTLLELIYGLMDIEKGGIFYQDQKLLGPKFHLIPGHPFMKYLAQDFNLMPYTTVAENVGEFLSNIYKDVKKNRVFELLEVVDMVDFANIKVKNLSGGQKQRVAIAKVLAKEPEILLLDEPFSHIDNFRKNNLRRKLFGYLKAQKISCIVATHDSTDALSFADSVYIIQNKQMIAQGNPQDVYQNPKTKYIASFFNEVNEVPATDFGKDSSDNLLLYPEQIKIVSQSNIKATVTNCFYKGHFFLIECMLNQHKILVSHDAIISLDTEIYLSI